MSANDENGPETPPKPDLLKELQDLHHKLRHYREYHLEEGKWDPKILISLVELRRDAAIKVIEALNLGHNRGTIVESLLYDLGISPVYPSF